VFGRASLRGGMSLASALCVLFGVLFGLLSNAATARPLFVCVLADNYGGFLATMYV